MGDTHSNTTWWGSVVRPAIRDVRPNAVLSVGDFGYWPDHDEGRAFLAEVSDSLAAVGTSLWFVDGNHEQHDRLTQGAAPVTLQPGIHHLPRGARWTWRSIQFGALGGAVSPDRADRIEGWDWFESERITEADLERLGAAQLDVLVTHDAPTWCRLDVPAPGSVTVDRDVRENRAFVDRAIAATAPSLVLHGHWHVAHVTPADAAQSRPAVVGLGADNDRSASVALLEIDGPGTPTYSLTWLTEPFIALNRPLPPREEQL